MAGSRTYDAAIVGGGHNGLVAAAYLARAGLSCIVLERRAELGGAAVSEKVFDGVGARLSRYSYLVSLLPEQIIEELGLRLALRRREVSSYTPDPRVGGDRGLLVDERDQGATHASFDAVSPGGRDQQAWEALYAMTRRAAQVLFPTLTEPLRSRDQLRELLGQREAWDALFERPIGETVADLFSDDLVAGVVLTDALIGTFTEASAPELLANRCFLLHVIGGGTGDWRVPVGGMGAVSGALIDAALGAGAEMHTGAEVTAIEPATDGAQITYSDGSEELTVSARHLLANLAPRELSRLLGESEGVQPEGAQLKINMVLSRLPRLRDSHVTPEQAFGGTFHVNETASQLERAYRDAEAARIPTTVPCETYCHSLTDPSILDPELRSTGAQTMTLFALHMPARIFHEDNERARAAALAASLESLNSVLAEPIEDCLLRAPDGSPCLEARTPLDIEQELRMPAGHIFHRSLSWPFAESDAEVGSWGVETPHPSIMLCGAGAKRGGGVSGIPGRNAAMAVLQARSELLR
jgi:phytoene dehydrogenase-like protein